MATPNPRHEIAGYFISFSDEEKHLVNEGLAALGYTTDMQGLKEYILDGLTGEGGESEPKTPNDHISSKLEELIINNPEAVQKISQATSTYAQALMSRFFSKRGK